MLLLKRTFVLILENGFLKESGTKLTGLFFSALVSLLLTIRVPFNLLYTSVGSPQVRIHLNIYYSHIVSCLKRSEEVALPLCRFRGQTRSSIWKNDPELKTIKNRAKYVAKNVDSLRSPFKGECFRY